LFAVLQKCSFWREKQVPCKVVEKSMKKKQDFRVTSSIFVFLSEN